MPILDPTWKLLVVVALLTSTPAGYAQSRAPEATPPAAPVPSSKPISPQPAPQQQPAPVSKKRSPWGAQFGFLLGNKQYERFAAPQDFGRQVEHSADTVNAPYFGLDVGLHRSFGPFGLGILFDVNFLSMTVRSHLTDQDVRTGSMGYVLQAWLRVWRLRPFFGAGYGIIANTLWEGQRPMDDYSPVYERVVTGVGFQPFRRSEWEVRPYVERLLMHESYEETVGLARGVFGYGVVIGKISHSPRL